MSWQSFLYMGGYGMYVWPAYGLTALVLIGNLLWPVLQIRQFRRQWLLKQKRAQR